jgi:uncharacterized protein YlzI (FlbEa/FlbD family)
MTFKLAHNADRVLLNPNLIESVRIVDSKFSRITMASGEGHNVDGSLQEIWQRIALHHKEQK